MNKKALIGGYVITGPADREMRQADILVEDGRIALIGTIPEENRKECQVIDCSGKYIMPGLINMHAHLFGSGKPSKTLGGGGGQKFLMKLIKTGLGHKIVDSLVSRAVKEELYSGVTTLRSVGDFEGSDLRIREKIRRGEIPGPRLFCSGTAITVPGGHGDGTFASIADTPQGLRALVDAHAQKGVDLIKICVTGGVMDATEKGSPGLVRMNLEETRAVCDRAHELGLRVASHTESPDGMKIAIEGGVDTIEHGARFDEAHGEILRERRNGKGGVSGIIVTCSPALPLSKLPPEISKLNDLCVYNSGVVMDGMIEGAARARQMGIPVGLGTDASCPFAAQHGMWREVWYYQKLSGVSREEAIAAATIVNAQILGLDDVTGSVETGKYADLLILGGNPLEDLSVMRDPYGVVKEGVLYQTGVKKNCELEAELDRLMEGL